MRFKQFLIESEEKKAKEQKLVFKETDGKSPFPENTLKALRSHISASSANLEIEWNTPIDVVNLAFTELDVPQPMAGVSERWNQYVELLDHATTQLYKARGNSYTKLRSV